MKAIKRIPKVLKINRIEKSKLKIFVLFSTGEDRVLDFNQIFRKEWKIKKSDPEFILLTPNEFCKVSLSNHTLCWTNVLIPITSLKGGKRRVPYTVGADTLYDLSEVDETLHFSIGSLFKKARLEANLSQEQVALLAGTSRTYITKLESDRSDIELMTLKKLVEAGLNRSLEISIK